MSENEEYTDYVLKGKHLFTLDVPVWTSLLVDAGTPVKICEDKNSVQVFLGDKFHDTLDQVTPFLMERLEKKEVR